MKSGRKGEKRKKTKHIFISMVHRSKFWLYAQFSSFVDLMQNYPDIMTKKGGEIVLCKYL